MEPQQTPPLDRAEKAERGRYKKALPKAVKAAAKGSGWRCSQGYVFREAGDWFVYATLGAHLPRRETNLRLWIKPMQIDPLFWRIVGLEGNAAQPLSFRVFGAWTCQPPRFFTTQLVETDGPEKATAAAADLIATADKQLPALDRYTAEDFLALCQRVPRPENFLAARVTTLILLGRKDQARALCDDATRQGHVGGFMSGGKPFPRMASEWLAAQG